MWEGYVTSSEKYGLRANVNAVALKEETHLKLARNSGSCQAAFNFAR
jgi:hypothetical protein